MKVDLKEVESRRLVIKDVAGKWKLGKGLSTGITSWCTGGINSGVLLWSIAKTNVPCISK